MTSPATSTSAAVDRASTRSPELRFFSLVLLLVRPRSPVYGYADPSFASTVPWPQKTYLAVAGLDGKLRSRPRGERSPMRFRRSGRQRLLPKVVWLFSGDWRSREFQPSHALCRQRFVAMVPGNRGSYTEQTRAALSVWSVHYHPSIPAIVDLELVAQHPTEPKPQTFHFSGHADVASPKDKMELKFPA